MLVKKTTVTWFCSLRKSPWHDCPALILQVHVVLLRRNEEIRANVTVPFLGSDGARRILGWNGLIVQETPRSMKEAGPVPAGLCISQTLLGSPAEASAIEGNFILGVDGIPTPNLESLLRVGGGGGALPSYFSSRTLIHACSRSSSRS